MILPDPIHAPLAALNQKSSTQDKLDLYRTLFASRSDHTPTVRKRPDDTKLVAETTTAPPATPRYLLLTDVITEHLTKDNPSACELYVILPIAPASY